MKTKSGFDMLNRVTKLKVGLFIFFIGTIFFFSFPGSVVASLCDANVFDSSRAYSALTCGSNDCVEGVAPNGTDQLCWPKKSATPPPPGATDTTATCDATKCNCSVAAISSSAPCDPARYCEIKRSAGVGVTIYSCGLRKDVSPNDVIPAGTSGQTGGIGSPKTWLSQIAPGEGIPSSSLGLSFITGYFVPFAISALIFLIIIGALFMMVWGGIMWISSSGNKESLTKAKATITHALVGLALGISVFIILGILGRLLGVQLVGGGAVDPGSNCTSTGTCEY